MASLGLESHNPLMAIAYLHVFIRCYLWLPVGRSWALACCWRFPVWRILPISEQLAPAQVPQQSFVITAISLVPHTYSLVHPSHSSAVR